MNTVVLYFWELLIFFSNCSIVTVTYLSVNTVLTYNTFIFILFFLAAQKDCPHCVYHSAQKERGRQTVTETPESIQALHHFLKGEWNHVFVLFLLFHTWMFPWDLVLLQKVLLKEIPELSNYIDRSQLTAQLGGYLIYCHRSWVAFIKVIIDLFSKDVLLLSKAELCITWKQNSKYGFSISIIVKGRLYCLKSSPTFSSICWTMS